MEFFSSICFLMAYIYIADPDSETRLKLQQYFSVQGFSVEGFSLLADLGKAMQKLLPDFLIMELDFSDGDGFQFLRRTHVRYSLPIMVASQRESESDRIMSFELGCDDFVGKPYSMKEVTLRVIAILRRRRKNVSPESVWYLRNQVFSINWDAHTASINGKEIRFTASEWKILSHLIGNAGSLVSRLQLLQSCFPESLESYDRIIDTHIKNIRAKLGACNVEWIETVRGYGYRFRGSPIRK